jgi:hypothetical protein
MLVCDTPTAIDLAQSDRQSEEEPAFFWRTAERGGAAPHDGDGESDIFASRDSKLFYVERLRWLVVPEEQIPCLLVLIHPSRLQRRRDVEHHDVLFMMGKNS